MSNIVEIASNAGTFKTLVAAVSAAGLADTLAGPGPFTVFAPTDEAFDALPDGTVAGLLQDIPALTKILTFHVVAGKVMAADLSDGLQADSLEGGKLTFHTDGGVTVNNATVTQADIEADNGVIHVIDSVLMPA
ncbi:MAG: fasciclin domain-containing protein [Pseudolysinimonas sp.]|uniref:fasciclin domain-containing protein n=1 Tax=Pseudolysinimonas sp. TaxID=2680009 RepID=UPI003264E7C5